jgi:hypothetical protein
VWVCVGVCGWVGGCVCVCVTQRNLLISRYEHKTTETARRQGSCEETKILLYSSRQSGVRSKCRVIQNSVLTTVSQNVQSSAVDKHLKTKHK